MKIKKSVAQKNPMQKPARKTKKEIIFKLPTIHIGGGKK